MPDSTSPSGGCLRAAEYPSNIIAHPQSGNVVSLVENWVAEFNHIFTNRDVSSFKGLFFDESYWRDHLTHGLDFRTLKGHDAMQRYARLGWEESPSAGVKIGLLSGNSEYQQPRICNIDKHDEICGAVSFLSVETETGFGRGYVRLLQDSTDEKWKAFTLFTSLEELKGHPESTRHGRPNGQEQRREKDCKINGCWKEKPSVRADHAVLIVGAGQAGLSTSARLNQLGVSNVVIDQNAFVGDGWRRRYSRLVLHDPVWYNHFPYMPFPETWPVFTPKDRLADWLKIYAAALDLEVWTSTRVKDAKWVSDRWQIRLHTKTLGGTTEIRSLQPRHIIMATGQAGKMKMPSIEGMHSFEGSRLCHSSHFTGAQDVLGTERKAVVVGSGTSAHDIAQEYCLNGYNVTMVQRSPTCVDPSQYAKGKDLYKEDGPVVEDADLVTQSLPTALLKRLQIETTDNLYCEFASFFEGLQQAGFSVDRGPDGAGRKLRFLDDGGGYYIDVGASGLIIDGHIKVCQGQSVQYIKPNGLLLSNGTFLEADEIVFATGFTSMLDTARDIFGDQVADQCKEVWGLNHEGELNSAWRQSGYRGLWFAAGNLAMTRYYSRLLALQIKACELGLRSRGRYE